MSVKMGTCSYPFLNVQIEVPRMTMYSDRKNMFHLHIEHSPTSRGPSVEEKHNESCTSTSVERHAPGKSLENSVEIASSTESKIRAKQLRKEGHEPTKRKKPAEAYYDDLGDDLS